jgi:hypothetical protein
MEIPGDREPNPINGLPGLAQISPAPFDLLYSVLPSGILNHSVAAVGTRIFFIVDDKRILSTVVGWSSQPTVLATAPACHTIDQVVAAGHEIAYVESWPIGMPFETNGCGSSSSIAWSIWLLDLQSGAPHLTAAGVGSGGPDQAGPLPVHLALSDVSYAFDRPNSGSGASPALPAANSTAATGSAGETIEVRSVVDNTLLWSTGTTGTVEELMLGGSRLAVLQLGADAATRGLDLEIGDAAHPVLETVSHPATAMSISDDGSYLAWDVASNNAQDTPAGVEMRNVGTGATSFVAAQSAAAVPEPLQPVVSAANAGPILAWRATADGGSVYPAFQTSANGHATAIASVQTTAWMSLQGTVLIWIAAAVDGSLGVAYAFDLAGPRPGH